MRRHWIVLDPGCASTPVVRILKPTLDPDDPRLNERWRFSASAALRAVRCSRALRRLH